MQKLAIFSLLALLPLNLFAAEEAPLAPVQFTPSSYRAWIEALKAPVSPFFAAVFAWNSAQENQPLPAEVARDPAKLLVLVERPLKETIDLETAGEIPEAVTVGLESYGILDAPIETVLTTVLFRSGKPVDAKEGTTFPIDSIFGLRMETLVERWGSGAYYVTNHKTRGGIVLDQNDSYAMLVRGNPQQGYLVLSSYLAPTGSTETQTSLTVVRLKPLADGKTDYRISSRHMGQSYGFFEVDQGRRSFGFNVERIRTNQLEFYGQVKELKTTGKISERKR